MRIKSMFASLLARHGAQLWWPGESPFEIMAGAVLVQRTAWRNAEQALASLKAAGLCDWEDLAAVAQPRLEELIRGAGFYRRKAARLSNLANFVIRAGGEAALARWPTSRLRCGLLGLDGIGAETADAILLYAFERRVFVIDAYTRRIVARMRGSPLVDAVLQRKVVRALPRISELNEFHALIVAHGKQSCRAVPLCESCCLRRSCHHGGGHGARINSGTRSAAPSRRGSLRRAETDKAL
jgi:endonuclease III related protein